MSIIKRCRFLLIKFLPIWSGLILYGLVGNHGYSASFSQHAHYSVCFSPGGNCTEKLLPLINTSQKRIFIQSYSFTSKPIFNALLAAKKRGVLIKIIADASQIKKRRGRKRNNSMIPHLIQAGIPVWIDDTVRIAHNKVMIFDDKALETGSYNFTYSAHHFNSENMLIIHDQALANAYLKNWYREQRVSHLQSPRQ